MKKFIAIVLTITTMLLAVTACASTTTTDAQQTTAAGAETTAAKGETQKYALMMSHMTNAFVTTFSNASLEKAKELGVELTVFDGKKDVATQISQIESAITQGYAGIMVEPGSVDGIIPALKKANEAGIPIMTVIQKVTDQSLAASYVGGDDLSAGALEMEKAIEKIGGKGNIAILYGPMGSDAQLIRKKGYDEVLVKYPDVKIVFEQTANWVTDEALKVTENWLQSGTEIAAVVAQNDSMALGALKAVEDAKMADKIFVCGVDATPDGVAAIAEGRLGGSVSQDTAGMGMLSMETLFKLVNGETVEKEILTTPVWVTVENADQFK